MKNFRHIKLFTFLTIAIICFGCSSEEEECPDIAIPYLGLNIRQQSKLAIDSILIYNDKLTNDLYFGTRPADSIIIPLDLNADSTLLNIKFTIIANSQEQASDTLLAPYLSYFNDSVAEIVDQIKLLHTKKTQLKDLNCGFINKFYLHQIYYTNQIVDSVYILDTVINSAEKNHVTIFY